MNVPIICTLTADELRERRRAVLDSIRSRALDITEIADGFSLSFNPGPDLLSQLSNLVDLERQCCQFLTFRIVVEPQQPIRLEVSGPPEAKAVTADFWGHSGPLR